MTATCVTRLAASARGQADVRPRYIEAPPAPIQPGAVRRSLLIERLAKDGACPIVSVAAPPGYGKTTLLTQWAEHSAEAFAWVSIDERDNDPKVLLTYIAETLNAIEPMVLSWMTCTSWTTGSARLRCRCWPIMCRAVRGWCWEAGPTAAARRMAAGPRAGSWRSAKDLPLTLDAGHHRGGPGTDHPDTAIRLGNLAATYRDLGRGADALPLENELGKFASTYVKQMPMRPGSRSTRPHTISVPLVPVASGTSRSLADHCLARSVAQPLAETAICKQGVRGSSPLSSTGQDATQGGRPVSDDTHV
jgi:hypothetical protein